MKHATPPELIILDFDGVVADSELLSNTLLADFLTQEGLPTTIDEAISR
jgi:beta-phosphoglucomutase-like phosphatase (HAD superfamily)